jgi:RNA polymerase sigma-70 factor (ECF subfamily)
MSAPDVLKQLLATAPAAARKGLAADPALGDRIAQRVAQVDGSDEFAAFVGSKLPASDLERGFETLRLPDLLLTFRCLGGSAEAAKSVQQLVNQWVEREAHRLKISELIDEARQVVLSILFVTDKKKQSVLAQYSGRGDLGAWVRIVAVRELLRLRKAGRRDAGTDDSALSDLVAGGDDPELGLLRTQFKAEFRAAFAHAIKGLTERERNLLRQHFVDGLSIDEIASIYAVHRATAARWVAKAKEEISAATREEIRQRINIGSDELNSLLRLVESRLEVSMRLLQPSDDT